MLSPHAMLGPKSVLNPHVHQATRLEAVDSQWSLDHDAQRFVMDPEDRDMRLVELDSDNIQTHFTHRDCTLHNR